MSLIQDQSIGDRIRLIREAASKIRGHNVSQTEFARHLNWTQARLSNYENGHRTPGIEELSEICYYSGVNILWLLTGKGDIAEQGTPGMDLADVIGKHMQRKKDEDVTHVDNAPGTPGSRVPLISWVQAGDWAEAIDNFEPGDAEEWISCPVRHGTHTYALKVSGDSMTAAHGKSYPDGSIIYVDPDKVGGVTTGDRVIAKMRGSNSVTFKVFVDDAGLKFLKPLNSDYPWIKEEFRVLGKVIAKLEVE